MIAAVAVHILKPTQMTSIPATDIEKVVDLGLRLFAEFRSRVPLLVVGQGEPEGPPA